MPHLQAWWQFKYMGLQDNQISRLANSPDPFVCASWLSVMGAMHTAAKRRANSHCRFRKTDPENGCSERNTLGLESVKSMALPQDISKCGRRQR
ncbi:hypothetical protein T265_12124 [Opisthorchis viverrini]|uniref:Uncharacterized protein n=1 Tax=Opisthorchis viverrini TaxID=6198 RepID=A0A074Z6I7_OPIVI|nr:hypothetical protein T265_12124 [Opisthorchis viverrini]KER18865.1 hypothetical protein T265_12124 [Opisthorchis viverrini]